MRLFTNGEDIANHLNQHFSEIGVKLSSVGTQNHNVRSEMFLKQDALRSVNSLGLYKSYKYAHY